MSASFVYRPSEKGWFIDTPLATTSMEVSAIVGREIRPDDFPSDVTVVGHVQNDGKWIVIVKPAGERQLLGVLLDREEYLTFDPFSIAAGIEPVREELTEAVDASSSVSQAVIASLAAAPSSAQELFTKAGLPSYLPYALAAFMRAELAERRQNYWSYLPSRLALASVPLSRFGARGERALIVPAAAAGITADFDSARSGSQADTSEPAAANLAARLGELERIIQRLSAERARPAEAAAAPVPDDLKADAIRDRLRMLEQGIEQLAAERAEQDALLTAIQDDLNNLPKSVVPSPDVRAGTPDDGGAEAINERLENLEQHFSRLSAERTRQAVMEKSFDDLLKTPPPPQPPPMTPHQSPQPVSRDRPGIQGRLFRLLPVVLVSVATTCAVLLLGSPEGALKAATDAARQARTAEAKASASAAAATEELGKAQLAVSIAGTQASNAETSAGDASGSAATAADKAALATTKAGEAAISATSAASDADTAATEADNAKASADSAARVADALVACLPHLTEALAKNAAAQTGKVSASALKQLTQEVDDSLSACRPEVTPPKKAQ